MRLEDVKNCDGGRFRVRSKPRGGRARLQLTFFFEQRRVGQARLGMAGRVEGRGGGRSDLVSPNGRDCSMGMGKRMRWIGGELSMQKSTGSMGSDERELEDGRVQMCRCGGVGGRGLQESTEARCRSGPGVQTDCAVKDSRALGREPSQARPAAEMHNKAVRDAWYLVLRYGKGYLETLCTQYMPCSRLFNGCAMRATEEL